MKTVELLTAMHAENRADHAQLVQKVDAGFSEIKGALTAHAREDDARFTKIALELQPLTKLHEGVKWAKRTLYSAAVVALLAEGAHILMSGK